MELKTLKIDSDLHEKLKELADDKNTSMQNLIEKKLLELVSHEDDILFDIDKIKYDPQFKKYGLELSEESFNKLITFFEIFLTNRNLKNVKEIENILQLISKLKGYEADKLKKVKDDMVNKGFTKEEDLDEMIKNVSKNNIPFEKPKADINYDNFFKPSNSGLANILTQLDSIRFNMAKENLSEKYVSINGHDFIKPTQEAYNKQKEEYFKTIELTVMNKILKKNYLNIGDVLKDPKTNLEYSIAKIYNDDLLFEEPSYVLKNVGIREDFWMNQFKDDTQKIDIDKNVIEVEKLFSKKQLIEHNFLLGDKLLLEIIDNIDFEHTKIISKLLHIKEVAYDLAMDMKRYKLDTLDSSKIIDEKVEILEKEINEELDYETMKSTWIKTKVWFEEFKIKD